MSTAASFRSNVQSDQSDGMAFVDDLVWDYLQHDYDARTNASGCEFGFFTRLALRMVLGSNGKGPTTPTTTSPTQGCAAPASSSVGGEKRRRGSPSDSSLSDSTETNTRRKKKHSKTATPSDVNNDVPFVAAGSGSVASTPMVTLGATNASSSPLSPMAAPPPFATSSANGTGGIKTFVSTDDMTTPSAAASPASRRPIRVVSSSSLTSPTAKNTSSSSSSLRLTKSEGVAYDAIWSLGEELMSMMCVGGMSYDDDDSDERNAADYI